MSLALVSLGSNLGDRKEKLHDALERIAAGNQIRTISDIYETYIPNRTKQDPYLNCCIEVETDMSSGQFMQFLIEIQRQLAEPSSQEHVHHQAIDIDLVGFDDEVLRTPQLTLPHPDAYRRAFVMVPLAQMKPDWVHPILNRRAVDLAKEAYWDGWGTFFMHGKSLLDF